MGIPLQDLSHLGDPSGMEALASELLLRADSVAGIAQSLSRQVGQMTFEGPAADVLRDGTEERQRRAQRVAVELQEAAYMLKRNASAVREQIYEIQLAARRQQEEGS
jgi:hypothetical protein